MIPSLSFRGVVVCRIYPIASFSEAGKLRYVHCRISLLCNAMTVTGPAVAETTFDITSTYQFSRVQSYCIYNQ